MATSEPAPIPLGGASSDQTSTTSLPSKRTSATSGEPPVLAPQHPSSNVAAAAGGGGGGASTAGLGSGGTEGPSATFPQRKSSTGGAASASSSAAAAGAAPLQEGFGPDASAAVTATGDGNTRAEAPSAETVSADADASASAAEEPGPPAAAAESLSSTQPQSPGSAAGAITTPSPRGGSTGRHSNSGSTGDSTTAAVKKTPPTASWDYATPLPNRFFRPALTDLCFPVLAKHFAEFPGLGNLPANERLRVVNEIALDLDLQLAADLIPEETYWKRKVQAKWRNCDITAHGCSWKQLFFERNLADALERFDVTVESEKRLEKLIKTSAPYVHSLDVTELPSHISFLKLFNALQRDLTVLRVRFGDPNCGWNYNRQLWGMKRSDCLSLSRAMSSRATTLTTLHLSGNRLDPEKMGILAEGLMANPIVVDLDLSSNFLGDEGVRHVCNVVKASNSVLGMLNLASNFITAQGCVYLAACEDRNQSLVSLNLCFNRFGDLGGKRIIDWANNNTFIQADEVRTAPTALYGVLDRIFVMKRIWKLELLGRERLIEYFDINLLHNPNVHRLNIECCDIGEDSAQSFVRLMHNPHSALTSINMSGNHAIGVQNGELILLGLEAGKQMKELWISNCGCGEALESKILTFLVERLFGRSCFHHEAVRDIAAVDPAAPQPDKEVLEEKAKKKSEEEAKAKQEAEEKATAGYEEDEEEKKEREAKETAEKEAQEKAAAEAAAAAAAAAAAEVEARRKAEEDSVFHVGHGHGEACTLECARMVGLPSQKPPPEPIVFPENYPASREAQAAIKQIQDSKPYWGASAIKDLKDKNDPE